MPKQTTSQQAQMTSADLAAYLPRLVAYLRLRSHVAAYPKRDKAALNMASSQVKGACTGDQ